MSEWEERTNEKFLEQQSHIPFTSERNENFQS